MLATLRSMASSTSSVLCSTFVRGPRETKPADVLAIANAVLDAVDAAGGSANLIRVQRLTALAQLWSVALRDRPLFSTHMGVINGRPVIHEIHAAFRRFDFRPITARASIPEMPQFEWPSDEDPERLEIIRSVVSAYARFDDYRLGEMLAELLEDAVVNGRVDQVLASQRLLEKVPA